MSCFGTEETKILFSSHCLSIILASRFKIDDVPEKYLCTQNLLTESFFDFFKRQWEKLNCTTQEIDFLPIFAGELNKTCLNCLICRSWSVSLNINDRQKINIIYRTQAWMKNVSSIVQFYKNIVVCLR